MFEADEFLLGLYSAIRRSNNSNDKVKHDHKHHKCLNVPNHPDHADV